MMKKNNIYIIIMSVLLLSALAGCKLENSHNGKLDGYWKLCNIDELDTDNTIDMTSQSIFWSVEKDLLMVRDNNDPTRTEYVFRFTQNDTELVLSDGQRYDKHAGNESVTEIEKLYKFGIYTQPITYHKDHLTSSRMTLSTSGKRLSFKKF